MKKLFYIVYHQEIFVYGLPLWSKLKNQYLNFLPENSQIVKCSSEILLFFRYSRDCAVPARRWTWSVTGSVHVLPKLLMCATSWFSCRNGWWVDFRYIRGDHLNHPPPTIKIKSIATAHPPANDEARWGRERIYQAKSGNIFSRRLRRIARAPRSIMIINERWIGEERREDRI